jgi:hypothetical protein
LANTHRCALHCTYQSQEPSGTLNLDIQFAHHLGLDAASEAEIRTFYALHNTKPVSVSEAALIILGLPLIQKSKAVHFHDTTPPHLRKRRASKAHPNGCLHVAPVTKYCGRPAAASDYSFMKYYKQCLVLSPRETRTTQGFTFLGKDAWSNNVYRINDPSHFRLVRMSNYNPVSSTEAFFYNKLLQLDQPFANEDELLGHPDNDIGSYALEYHLRGFLDTPDQLEDLGQQYAQQQLMQQERFQTMQHELLNGDLAEWLGVSGDGDGMPRDRQAFPVDAALRALHDLTHAAPEDIPTPPQPPSFRTEFANEAHSVMEYQLTQDQQTILDNLMASAQSHTITSTPAHMAILGCPGAGKTVLAKHIAVALSEGGMNVALCASTGAAASRLSIQATTAHAMFGIPASGGVMQNMSPCSPFYQRLAAADYILVDELSMLTSFFLDTMFETLRKVEAGQPASKRRKTLILLGDMAQVICPALIVYTHTPSITHTLTATSCTPCCAAAPRVQARL